MGCLALELNMEGRAGDLGMGQLMMVGTGMHTQRSIHILEETLPDKAALGAAVFAAFLTGRAVENDGAADHRVVQVLDARDEVLALAGGDGSGRVQR